MNPVFKSILSLITTLYFVGCTPTRYSHINVLEHNNQSIAGKFVDNVWISKSQFNKTEFAKLSLDEINIDSISDEKGVTKQGCKEELSKDILSNENNNGLIVAKDNSLNNKLRLVITNMSPGDAASRIWAGEFGFGHANVEIQAILFNS